MYRIGGPGVRGMLHCLESGLTRLYGIRIVIRLSRNRSTTGGNTDFSSLHLSKALVTSILVDFDLPSSGARCDTSSL